MNQKGGAKYTASLFKTLYSFGGHVQYRVVIENIHDHATAQWIMDSVHRMTVGVSVRYEEAKEDTNEGQ